MKKRALQLLAGPCLFLLVWTVIYSVPRLRYLSSYQLARDQYGYAPWGAPPLVRLWVLPDLYQNDEGRAFGARHPDDARVQAWIHNDMGSDGAKKLEPLLRQFPSEAWLHAKYLRDMCSSYRSGRVPGTLYPKPLPDKPANLSPAQLSRAIDVARHGAALEPQNCFWDIMESVFLFGARRDNEAVRAWLRGSRKPHYDEHNAELLRHFMAAEEIERPLLVEEKFSTWTATLYPHPSQFRQSAQQAVWCAMQKQSRGAWREGLEIRAAVARLATRMRDQKDSRLITLVSYAIQSIGLRGGAQVPKNAIPKTNGRQFWAKYFSADCRAHGAADLIAEASREALRTDSLSTLTKQANTEPLLPNRDWMRILACDWMGAALFWLVLCGLPVWVVLSGVLLLARVPGAHRSPSEICMLSGGTLLVGVAVTLLSACGGAGWDKAVVLMSDAGAFPQPMLDLGASLPVLQWLVVAVPVAGSALLCGVVTWRRHRNQWRAADAQTAPEGVPSPMWRRICWLSLVACALGAFYGWWQPPAWVEPPIWHMEAFRENPIAFSVSVLLSPACGLYLPAMALAWWIFSAVRLVPQSARPLAGEALKWYHRTLGVILLATSILYLVLLCAGWRWRSPAERALLARMQHGEMGILRNLAQSEKSK